MSPFSSHAARRLPLIAILGLAACGSPAAATAAEPRPTAAREADAQPPRTPRRSHIQSVGELATAMDRDTDDFGLRLSRASTVLRQQLDLTRGAGLVVDEVAAGSRAARAGFRQHDVLVLLDDQLLLLPEQFAVLLESATEVTPLQCTVLRGGRRVKLPLAANEGLAGGKPGLRPAASALAIVREAGQQPRATIGPDRDPPADPPGRLARISSETLLRQDADFQIRLTSGEETRLVVTDNRGRVVFDDAIDTPEARSRMPLVVRQRVEEMERRLERKSSPAAAEIGSLEVAPIVVR